MTGRHTTGTMSLLRGRAGTDLHKMLKHTKANHNTDQILPKQQIGDKPVNQRVRINAGGF